MLVARIVVETLPWKVPDGDTLEDLSEVLQVLNPKIVQVYPTFVGQEDWRNRHDGHGDHDRNSRSRG